MKDSLEKSRLILHYKRVLDSHEIYSTSRTKNQSTVRIHWTVSVTIYGEFQTFTVRWFQTGFVVHDIWDTSINFEFSYFFKRYKMIRMLNQFKFCSSKKMATLAAKRWPPGFWWSWMKMIGLKPCIPRPAEIPT